MDKGTKIRDHLTLVYAIQTQHPAVRDQFPLKNVLLTPAVYQRIEQAKEQILAALRRLESRIVPFSPRLERRAIQLACAMSLPAYFAGAGQHILVRNDALDLAIKFFVEEAVTRSQEKINQDEILSRLGIPA